MTGMRSLALMLGLALVAPALPAAAEDQQVVYWPLVTDGMEYRRVAYPREAGEMVVMAGTTVVLEAREANVSWWPITREYLSDVSRAAPVVAGRLEIQDEAGQVLAVTPEPYVVWHPDGVGLGPSEIVSGPAAAEVYETYVRYGRAAAEAAQLHQRLVAEHHAAVEAWLKLAAQKPADLPPPPPEFTIAEPEPYHAYASAPETAAVLSLPEGNYRLRLVDDAGAVVPGSERQLVSLAPRATGIGYVVRPGDRWTQPAISFGPQETIYSTGRSALYLQPVPVAEYAARQFSRLFQPQSVEQADPFLSIWVPQAPGLTEGSTAELELWDGSSLLATVPTSGFRVEQNPGVARGYTIERYDPAAGLAVKPDFFAMEIAQGVMPSAIRLTADDSLPRSDRRVRFVEPRPDYLLFLPALLPLLIGGLFHLVRRQRRANRSPAPPMPEAGAA